MTQFSTEEGAILDATDHEGGPAHLASRGPDADGGTTEQHAIASVTPAIDECTFRMPEPSEIARGMVMHLNAYGEPYVIHGNRRDRVSSSVCRHASGDEH